MKTEIIKKTIKVDGVPIKINAELREDYEYKKMRIFLFPQNETIIENLGKRFARPQNTWKKIGKSVLKEFGYSEDTKVSFSQQAGCKCGCSPGLIVNSIQYKTIYVDYTI